MLSVLLEVLPALAKVVAGGRGEEIANIGTKIAKKVTGTDDPVELKAALTDPATRELFAALLEQETKQLVAAFEDVQSARQQTVELARAGSPVAYGPVVLSMTVIVGYMVSLWIVLFKPVAMNIEQATLANVLLGTLTGAFIQVCNYWLGSSAGSKRAGDAVRSIAEASVKNAK